LKKLALIVIVFLTVSACKEPPKPVKAIESIDFKKGEHFLNLQKRDSAFYHFDRVTTNLKDSLQIAMAYNYMASIQSDAGDYFGAQESLILSLAFLDEQQPKDRYCLASNYNELGMISSKLKNYDGAINYFDAALKFSDDKDYKLIFTNNKANAFRKKKDYSKALILYQQVLTSTPKDGKQYARVLTNLAITKWFNNPNYQAAPELLHALEIRKQTDDLWGQNSSYGHLADYFSAGDPTAALTYAKMRYNLSIQLNSADDQLEALDKLIKLSPLNQLKRYFTRYEQLSDSLSTVRNAAKNQFALIRYHIEKEKADNLKLQKDNIERSYELSQQRIRFYLMLFVFLVGTAVAIWWYKKRKRRSEEENRSVLQENRRNISKKVHDTLANDIYRIMKNVEHSSSLNKDWLMDNIDNIYQRARDISYDIIADPDEDFQQQIAGVLTGFATENTKVVLVGNEEELWQKVNAANKQELKYILQELMVNMQKHSQAGNVVVKFEHQFNRLTVSYSDDGIGFTPGHVPKNGLTNTGNRIKLMKGDIIFGNHSDKGLQIQLSFPSV